MPTAPGTNLLTQTRARVLLSLVLAVVLLTVGLQLFVAANNQYFDSHPECARGIGCPQPGG